MSYQAYLFQTKNVEWYMSLKYTQMLQMLIIFVLDWTMQNGSRVMQHFAPLRITWLFHVIWLFFRIFITPCHLLPCLLGSQYHRYYETAIIAGAQKENTAAWNSTETCISSAHQLLQKIEPIVSLNSVFVRFLKAPEGENVSSLWHDISRMLCASGGFIKLLLLSKI